MGNITRSNMLLSIIFATQASLLVIFIFWLSHADHDMKLLALGAVISQSSALMATASTVLVGKVFDSKQDPNTLPPGSVVTNSSKETTQLPPITENK